MCQLQPLHSELVSLGMALVARLCSCWYYPRSTHCCRTCCSPTSLFSGFALSRWYNTVDNVAVTMTVWARMKSHDQ
ncbi:hypothetical protein COO60DRAFT_1483992 [Scenedesmus sp. NREL 46B-D3]|nr:hypothetical protein COO60DRAFT_1483992 [Scenedesmus sp. NREL 46B-D3]